MDSSITTNSLYGNKILKSSVRVSIYFLILASLALVVYTLVAFSDIMTLKTIIVFIIFFFGFILAIFSFKKNELYEKGILIKKIITRKEKFIQFDKIEAFDFIKPKGTIIKFKNLLIKSNSELIVISTLLYPDVDKIHDYILKNVKKIEE